MQHCDPQEVKRAARELAIGLGAVDLRVASAQPDDRTRERLRASFRRGDLATWPYDDAYAGTAVDPARILPGARSVVCIAFAYRTDAPDPDRTQGRVSNYAWSADYHHRIKKVLEQIAARIDEFAGEPVTAIACDTKPIAERAFAERAGLGWIGKHTNLIVPGAGSFVFLGEIVTSLELPADEAIKKTCGSCTRCIPACPTGALRGDYTIDATRCIADLTQRTDAIPREMRALIGNWVWGCDLCQVACPPNFRSAPSTLENAPLSPETSTPKLEHLLRLRSSEFKRLYARTAMGWRGAAVLRRNAAVALGNAGDPQSVRALREALEEDPHPMVRGHVAWALGRIGSLEARDALRHRRSRENDESVREEIDAALEPA